MTILQVSGGLLPGARVDKFMYIAQIAIIGWALSHGT